MKLFQWTKSQKIQIILHIRYFTFYKLFWNIKKRLKIPESRKQTSRIAHKEIDVQPDVKWK